ncbi:MAG: A/G-specific adenine glycosylase [Gallionella sp.]|nr:A/G-specific adenine glycosylase [Gallionella sp.]
MTASFAARLIAWQRSHGRHDLPWQGADAYRVWLSEIMLQQTQVATVIPYYQRFVASFPDIVALAAATEEQVLEHWSGLGYYARGRNLHKAARLIVERYRGEFPSEFEQILELPGIGRSTAAAICALAYHQHRAILDGNVKRVLARYCGIAGWAGDKQIEAQLWQQAENLLPKANVAIYIQAQMDMGATVCTRSKPKCGVCPVQTDCVAYQTNQVAQLPTPRPRKAVPERHATFLVLMHGHDILLEKRPAQGIWGGLWCLPQLDDGGELVKEYVQRNGMSVNERAELAAFTHTFSHFKLHITPVVLHVAHKPLRVQEAGRVWLDVDEALQAAIPTPVRMMLELISRST